MNTSIVRISPLFYSLQASIETTSQIEAILPNVNDDSLVLFNIAEVLTDSEYSLGSSAWRRYIRSRLTEEQHDILTLWIYKNVPIKAPESTTADIITDLQAKNITVLAFTSRGRNEWYSTVVQGIDRVVEKVLKQLGMDFSKTNLPEKLLPLESTFNDFYHHGIIYGGNELEKGDLLKQILEETGYRPSQIIFADDKIASLRGVEESLETLGIPFVGIAYNKTSLDHSDFDPMVAMIQLDHLFNKNRLLTDAEAMHIKNEKFVDVDSESYFYELMQRIDIINAG